MFNMEKMIRGKSKFIVETNIDFLKRKLDDELIPQIWGVPQFDYNSLVLKSNNEIQCGFRTLSVDLRDNIILELSVNGIKETFNPILFELGVVSGNNTISVICEGTTNLKINDNQTIISEHHNIIANHGRLRNYTIRLNKNDNTISLLSDGQMLGFKRVENLKELLNSRYAYMFFREKLPTALPDETLRIGTINLKMYN